MNQPATRREIRATERQAEAAKRAARPARAARVLGTVGHPGYRLAKYAVLFEEEHGRR